MKISKGPSSIGAAKPSKVPKVKAVGGSTLKVKNAKKEDTVLESSDSDTKDGAVIAKRSKKLNAKVLRKAESLPESIHNDPQARFRRVLVPTFWKFLGCTPNPLQLPDKFLLSVLGKLSAQAYDSSGIEATITIKSAIWYNVSTVWLYFICRFVMSVLQQMESKASQYRTTLGNAALDVIYDELVGAGCNTVDERAVYAKEQLQNMRYLYADTKSSNHKVRRSSLAGRST